VAPPAQFLSPSEAARQLGVSPKALRIYEQRGLIAPSRTEAGWRVYGPDEMTQASEIVALRDLGLSLAQVGRVLAGNSDDLRSALGTHQDALENEARQLASTINKVHKLRISLAQGSPPTTGDLKSLIQPRRSQSVGFALPWPWGGERFELADIRALNYIIGPLGSGKTRFARQLSQSLPDAAFLELDRLDATGSSFIERLSTDADLKQRVERARAWITGEGGDDSEALTCLLAALYGEAPAVLAVDMIEQDLNQATQEALISLLRRRGADARPLFAMTRSSSILDLASVGGNETIILCPANHSPPTLVAPYPGAPGYEAVATCLASPSVRARTAGVVAWQPSAS
jgi:DNA-binding transcriptional MerR regulator